MLLLSAIRRAGPAMAGKSLGCKARSGCNVAYVFPMSVRTCCSCGVVESSLRAV
jgi:hypothetical protein